MTEKITLAKNKWGGVQPFPEACFQEMDEETTKYFCMAAIQEKKLGPQAIEQKDVKELPFEAQVVLKRIEARKLPIQFSSMGLLVGALLARNVGGAVTMLIDALNFYEGELVDVDKISKLYPMGFYDVPTFEKYVDEYLKKRVVKWSELY